MSTRTVFASGEAVDPGEAYASATKKMWAQITTDYPDAQVKAVQHCTTTRTRKMTGLNTQSWTTEETEISTVIVTLLATMLLPEGTKTK